MSTELLKITWVQVSNCRDGSRWHFHGIFLKNCVPNISSAMQKDHSPIISQAVSNSMNLRRVR